MVVDEKEKTESLPTTTSGGLINELYYESSKQLKLQANQL